MESMLSSCVHLVLFKLKIQEGNVLVNNTLNTFYLQLYGVRHNYGKGPVIQMKQMFYLMTHSTHFIYGYMASDIIW